MSMFNGIIYKVICLINKKVYIGKTVQSLRKRKNQHKHDSLNKKTNCYFHKAIRKYGWNNFKWEIIDTANNEQELNILEQLHIETHCQKGRGYNLADGGGGTIGYKHTDEAIEKMREASKGNKNRLGKHHTDETKQKLSIAHKGLQSKEKHPMWGRKHSTENRLKMSKAGKGRIAWNKGRKGYKLSDETKQKMSLAQKGNKNSLGYKHTEETCKKRSEVLKGNKYCLGHKLSKATKLKISEAGKAVWAKRKLIEACCA